MITDKELQEMEGRANAATEGKWNAPEYLQIRDWEPKVNGGALIIPSGPGNNFVRGIRCNDAVFIAAARSDLPRVIAELREARAVIESIASSIGDTVAIAAITTNYLDSKGGAGMKPIVKKVWTCETATDLKHWAPKYCNELTKRSCEGFRRHGAHPSRCRPITITIKDGHDKEGA